MAWAFGAINDAAAHLKQNSSNRNKFLLHCSVGQIMKVISKILTSHWFIGFAMLAGLLALYQSGNPHVERLRLRTFDFYQQLAPRIPDPNKMAAQVAIVDIDDASMAAFGQWPWPRTLLAQLIDKLMAYGVLVAGFDIVYSEPDRTSPDLFAKSVPSLPPEVAKKLSTMPSNEEVFAESLRRGRVVLGQAGIHTPTDVENLVRKVGYGKRTRPGVPDPELYLAQYPGVVSNLRILEEAASGIGLFSTYPDQDGVYRRVALIERVGNIIYPSLSLEMLRVALQGKDDYQINSRPDGGIAQIIVRTANPKQHFKIPTDMNSKVWVHFARYAPNDPLYVSAKDVLNGTVPANRLQGRLVVIGTSAAGLKDIRPTPINGALPGVEVHAQMLETILSGTHLTRPDKAIYIEAGMILLGGILMIFLVPRLNAVYTFLLSAALIGTLIFIAWHFYTTERVLVDASYPSLSIFTMFMTLSYLNYMREEKERQKVKTAFSHYVSPALLTQIAAHPEKLTLGGETRHITVMFSDIRGFTTISERFNAQELTRFINRYLTPMTNVIMNEKGTIDKYMGDAIMAFWNAPLDDEDHAVNACRAALKMQQTVKEMNRMLLEEAKAASQSEEESRRRYIPINIGVGLNSGPCCVGNMGSDQRFDYSALGDDVNLASRLEGQSKTYGVDVVLGQNTHDLIGNRFATIQLDLIQVKGKTEPVYIYALLGDETHAATPGFKAVQLVCEKMLAAYRTQAWDEAEKLAKELSGLSPDVQKLSSLYRERITYYREHPPGSDWNGVTIATSK